MPWKLIKQQEYWQIVFLSIEVSRCVIPKNKFLPLGFLEHTKCQAMKKDLKAAREAAQMNLDQYFLYDRYDVKVGYDGTIHAHQGRVHSKSLMPNGRLPVIFDNVMELDLSSAGLKTLKGCPKIVAGRFDISNNPDLKSLVHGPVMTKGYYRANGCGLTSLAGAPIVVDGDLELEDNQLVSKLVMLINQLLLILRIIVLQR